MDTLIDTEIGLDNKNDDSQKNNEKQDKKENNGKENNSKLKVITRNLINIAVGFLASIFILALLIVTFVNLKYNVSVRILDRIDSVVIAKDSIKNIAFVSILILSFIFVNIFVIYIFKKMSERSVKITNAIIIITLALSNIFLGYVWNLISFGESYSDSQHVLGSTISIIRGENFAHWYFLKYPWQIGLLGYEFVIAKMFNVDSLQAAEPIFRSINILQVAGSAIMIYWIYKCFVLDKVKEDGFKDNSMNLALVFLNIPLIMLTAFIYGDIPAIFFSLISIILILKALKDRKYYLILIAIIPMLMAMYVRQNSTIIFIAISMILILEIIRMLFKLDKYNKIRISKYNKRMFILFSVMFIVLTISINKVTINYGFERMQTREERFESVPLKNHIALGLNDGTGIPGWYDNNIAKNAESKAKVNHEFYDKYLKERISKFISDPVYTYNFFEKKLAVTWADPTYNVMHYNTLLRVYNKEDYRGFLREEIRNNPVMNSIYYGEDKYKFELMSEAILFITIIFAGYYILSKIIRRKKLNNAELLIMLVFMGGFTYHILSEIRGRYIFIYNLMIFPLALAGAYNMTNMLYIKISKVISRFNKTKYSKEDELEDIQEDIQENELIDRLEDKEKEKEKEKEKDREDK